MIGLFMGYRASPYLANVRMYTLEKKSIYIDLRLSLTFYSRFYDDCSGITTNRRKAQLACDRIESEDKDNLIKLKLDYPDSDQYTPFLNVEVKVSPEGICDTRLYRKLQKKLITLHNSSHHPTSVKISTIRNMYQTAEDVSSSPSNLEHSTYTSLVNNLLKHNSYPDNLVNKARQKPRSQKKQSEQHNTTLCLPFLSNQTTALFNKAVTKSGLAIKVVSKPGRKLKDILRSSRPLDKPQCTLNNCVTCRDLKSGKCTTPNCIYRITCNKCGDIYIGETYRPLHCRYIEHYRNASNPTAKSYINTPLAKHYTQAHPNCMPDLAVEILDTASSNKNRHIKEAKYILRL